MLDKCYHEGFQAYEEGLSQNQSPYFTNSTKDQMWREGWEDAFHESTWPEFHEPNSRWELEFNIEKRDIS